MSGALAEVARVIQRESGIVLGPAQLPSLEAAIARVDRQLTAEHLLAQRICPETIERLIDEVTIRETFFLRHRSELESIDWFSMLDAARERGGKHVRVWVAGCASGEEAYTVAILACEAFASVCPPVRVLGTDIAPAALRQALDGRYGKRATRALAPSVLERYFTTEGEVSIVGGQLRSLVEFRRHNLVRDSSPPIGEQHFDVVLCRNVLIYFNRPTVERVVQALEGALVPSGLLLLGAADRLSGPCPLSRRETQPAPAMRRLSGAATALRTAPLQSASRPGGEMVVSPSLAGDSKDAGRASRTSAQALKAADRGELELAIEISKEVLADDPLHAEAHFIRGLAEHARGNPAAAVEPLRRALYIDPNFIRAAFNLARAHDALGEGRPAVRAYQRALRTIDHCATEQTTQSDRLEHIDIAAACHARLQILEGIR